MGPPPTSHDDDERTAASAVVTADPVTRREEWGWYMYDAAVSSFYCAALPIFFPLLLNLLATDQAWRQAGGGKPPECSDSKGVTTDCMECVPGEGLQLLTSSGHTAIPHPNVFLGGLGMDPVAFTTVTLGVSVVCQVIAFVSLGPLADYGHGRMRLLLGGTVLGSVSCLICLALVSPTLWWLSGLLLVLANVGYGLAIVAFYSFLPVLVDASPVVLAAAAAAADEEEEVAQTTQPLLEARDKVENRISLTGVAIASIAAIISTFVAFACTLPVSSDSLKLRLALLACGLWWILLSLPTFAWLKPRPGPPFPSSSSSSSSSSCCLNLSLSCVFSGWHHMGALLYEARSYRHTFAFLLCYFVYADGYTTILQIGVLFGERDLCVPTATLVLLAACVSVAATAGAPLFFYLQRFLRLSNKTMVIAMLAGMLPLPLWGLLGYLTPAGSVGLKAVWELYLFACWFGFFLGGLMSYSRTLFIDMIPVGREAAFFSLYSVSDKGSSWLGPFIVAIIVQATGQIRPCFLYIFAVILAPLICLFYFVDHQQGIADAGRAKAQMYKVTDDTQLTDSDATGFMPLQTEHVRGTTL